MIISLIVGFRPISFHLLLLSFVFMILIAVFFTALGTAIASVLEDMQGFQLIMNFLLMPLFFLSGALFPLQGLPKTIASVVKVNPLSYGVDGLRATLTGGAHFGLMTDFLVLSIIAVIILALGSFLFSRIES